jgi:hypothetical protein
LGVTGATGIQVTQLTSTRSAVGLAPYKTVCNPIPVDVSYNINPNSYYNVGTDIYGRASVCIGGLSISASSETCVSGNFIDSYGVKYTYYDFSANSSFTVNSLGNSNGIVSLLLVGGGGGGASFNSSNAFTGPSIYLASNGASGGEVMLVDNFQVNAGTTYTINVGDGGAGAATSVGGDGSPTSIAVGGNTLFSAAGGKGSQWNYSNGVTYFDGSLGSSMYPVQNSNLLTSSGGGGICSSSGGVAPIITNPAGIGSSLSYGSAITPYVNSVVPPLTSGYNPGPVVWSYGNSGGNCDGSGNSGGGGGAGGPGTSGFWGTSTAYPTASSHVNNGGTGGQELFVYFTSSTTPVTSTIYAPYTLNPAPTTNLPGVIGVPNTGIGGIGGGANGLPIIGQSNSPPQAGTQSYPGNSGGYNTGVTPTSGSATSANPGTGCAGASAITNIGGFTSGGNGGSGRFILRFQSYT